MAPSDSDILTLEELHSYLKIPKPTLYALAQGGRIPAAKVGKHWRFLRSDINEWLKAQRWGRPLQRRQRRRKAIQGAVRTLEPREAHAVAGSRA